jgi:hypothetical protein
MIPIRSHFTSESDLQAFLMGRKARGGEKDNISKNSYCPFARDLDHRGSKVLQISLLVVANIALHIRDVQ